MNFHLEDQTLNKLQKLDPKKASQVNHIPVTVIKEYKGILAFFIHQNFNSLLSNSTALKYANVKPVFKKDDKIDKADLNQFHPYFDKPFSKF